MQYFIAFLVVVLIGAIIGGLIWLSNRQAAQAATAQAQLDASNAAIRADKAATDVLVRDQSVDDTIGKLQDGSF